MDLINISYIFSVISAIFYSIVYFPQFYLIYKTKSSDGLSLPMLLVWTQADVLSLDAIILLCLPINLILLGWFHFSIGLAMILTTLYYHQKRTTMDIIYTTCYVIINIIVSLLLNILINQPYNIVGDILGYITTIMYITGRFPQIILNYKRKSTEGLSILMYIFTILGNFFYILTVVIVPEYIEQNMPWIISGVVTILLDFYVIYQAYIYSLLKKVKNEVNV